MRTATVRQITPVGKHFVAVTFAGEALADFVSASFDDHIKFIFNDDNGEQLRRDYTPRHFNQQTGELTIEFDLSHAGKAANWARTAQAGTESIIAGPRGSMIIPADFDWHLLIADGSGMPAIRRRLEELPASARALVISLVSDEADGVLSASAAQVSQQCVNNADALLAAVRALPLPAGEGFVWAAGELAVMQTLRQVLITEKQLPKELMRVAAYWKPEAAGFHENLED
ncbi:NADPH-dependent ferric siderophore reductase [Silvimonas terrae]|uniref:NADPH-dependent ferric siderophore reductase n=1 Tax=Silvimonas terrae TaxID=300266 RepID=A0A840RGH9_9NEIS|nr:siderophore-interacting protein [Silvimonas terrae]MBB5191684.1 NADPH-dependent ferric siderophore reductase [Silvimonas terrae]